MAARTFTLTNVLHDASGAPVANRSVSATLLTPAGVPAVDPSAPAAIVPDVVSTTTDSSGAYSLTLTYPGDLTPLGASYVISEAGTGVASPPGFGYASSITTTAWYPGAGPAGTLLCRLVVRRADGSPVTNRRVHLSPQQNAVAPDGSLLSIFASVDVTLDGSGTALAWLWPTAALSPATRYTARIDGESVKLSVGMPSDPTGYAGVWSSGTAYLVRSGTSSSPSDVVDHAGVRYVALADSTGQTPPNATYWAVWAGEPILWHLLPFGTASSLLLPPTSVSHDADVVPVDGAPVSVPATLADDLRNLAYAASLGGGGGGGGGAPDYRIPSLTGAPVTVADGSHHNGQPSFAANPLFVPPYLAVWRQSTTAPCSFDGTGTNGGVIVGAGADSSATSWTAAAAIATPASGVDYQWPFLLCTAANTLLLAYTSLDATSSSAASTVHLLRSTDGGATWTAVSLAASYTGTGRANWNGGLVQLASGAILLAVWGKDTGWGDYGAGIRISTDDGATWGARLDIAASAGYGPTRLVETPAGTLHALLANPNLFWSVSAAVSTDGGATWSAADYLASGDVGTALAAAVLPTSDVLLLTLGDQSEGAPLLEWSRDHGATYGPANPVEPTFAAGGALLAVSPTKAYYLAAAQTSSSVATITRYIVTYAVPAVAGSARGGAALSALLAVLAAEGVITSTASLDGVLPAGVASGRPAGSHAGDAYFATDTAALSVWDGAAWVVIDTVSYSLPAATTSVRGGVRPDGSTITISGDVISAPGGGGGGGGMTYGTRAALDATPASAGLLYFAVDTGELFASSTTNWVRFGPGAVVPSFAPAALLYASPSTDDWLGSDGATPSAWATSVSGAGITPVYAYSDFFDLVLPGGGTDQTWYSVLPSGSEYHMVARWLLEGDTADVAFLRFGLSPSTVSDDGAWFHLNPGGLTSFRQGTTDDFAVVDGARWDAWNYVWLAVISGTWYIRVSTDGVTFHELFSGAISFTPTHGTVRVQTSAGPQDFWCQYIQYGNAAPAGVTVI